MMVQTVSPNNVGVRDRKGAAEYTANQLWASDKV